MAESHAVGDSVNVSGAPRHGTAGENNEDLAAAEFAERTQALSDAPPTFRNLDLLKVEER